MRGIPEKATLDSGFRWTFDAYTAAKTDEAAAKEVFRMRAKYNKAATDEEARKSLFQAADEKKKLKKAELEKIDKGVEKLKKAEQMSKKNNRWNSTMRLWARKIFLRFWYAIEILRRWDLIEKGSSHVDGIYNSHVQIYIWIHYTNTLIASTWSLDIVCRRSLVISIEYLDLCAEDHLILTLQRNLEDGFKKHLNSFTIKLLFGYYDNMFNSLYAACTSIFNNYFFDIVCLKVYLMI